MSQLTSLPKSVTHAVYVARATRVAVSLIRPRATRVDVICKRVELARWDLIAGTVEPVTERAV